MIEPPDLEVLVFNAAVELPAAERAAFLETECGRDAALRRRVDQLLEANERAGAFLAESSCPTAPADASKRVIKPVEGIGARVGRYKLLQQIGEGGCGVVFMAEQEEPVRRSVALKVIKLGMDTRQVIARFEAERQTLGIISCRRSAPASGTHVCFKCSSAVGPRLRS